MLEAEQVSGVRAENQPPWVGLDIGGANLKAAHTNGWTNCLPFPMWKQPQQLGSVLCELIHEAPAFVGVAVSMTGELADCFSTRAEGVAIILEQVTTILPSAMVQVFAVDGSWKSVAVAARSPWSVAASNWSALARFVAKQFSSGRHLIVDIGSTTTDLIPIQEGHIAIEAATDSQRLQCGALVYTGIERSNVSAISRSVPLFGMTCPLMNELFATAQDVHLWLGDLEDQPHNMQTADSRPATREAARYRLARVVGEDGSTLGDEDLDTIAKQIRHDQASLVATGIARVTQHAWSGAASKRKGHKKKVEAARETDLARPDSVIVFGHGKFLLEDALRILEWGVPTIDWSTEFGPEISRCAPAYAVAKLAALR